MQEFSNKRFYPRVNKSLEVTYSLDGGEEEVAIATDISASGLSIETRELITKGTVLKLSFHLKEMNKTVIAMGEAIRCCEDNDRNIAAIKFLEVPELDLIMLVDYTLANLNK